MKEDCWRMFRNGGRTPGGEQHGDIESWTGGAWYDNMMETSWGQGYVMVVKSYAITHQPHIKLGIR